MPMVHYIILTLKILSISIGVFLIISRVFLFEETQGKIQSRIETFWIQVDDFEKTAISKHVAFIKVVSKVISSGLDRIFGRALFSLQSLIVSVCYAVITCLIVLLCFLRYGSGNWNEDFLK